MTGSQIEFRVSGREADQAARFDGTRLLLKPL